VGATAPSGARACPRSAKGVWCACVVCVYKGVCVGWGWGWCGGVCVWYMWYSGVKPNEERRVSHARPHVCRPVHGTYDMVNEEETLGVLKTSLESRPQVNGHGRIVVVCVVLPCRCPNGYG